MFNSPIEKAKFYLLLDKRRSQHGMVGLGFSNMASLRFMSPDHLHLEYFL